MFTRNRIEPWKFMWLMTGAIFLGCKWLTFWRTKNQDVDLRVGRALGYLFAWPGMDASKFFRYEAERNSTVLNGRVLSWNLSDEKARGNRRHIREFPSIVFAAEKILFGCLLLFVIARSTKEPLLASWIGMTGLIFILHFGLFHLAAISWRRAGVDVDLIMNAPWRSKSLSEFWGRRWNGAFNSLVLDLLFRRFARSIGPVRATLTAFLISGLLHELVISLPACAGYGLPTAYFLLQGWSVIAQRAFGMRGGLAGWLFTMAIVAGPAFWLFHPPFVRRVVLPFMHAIHAL
jgi:alginate O-acetyltransferase complex protein AlgI